MVRINADASGIVWPRRDACARVGVALTLRMHEVYDHSYFFIATFIEDHLRWHAQRLGSPTT